MSATSITHGKVSRNGSYTAWVDYPDEPLSHEANALIAASTNNEVVLLQGPPFSIQGKVRVTTIGCGALSRVARLDGGACRQKQRAPNPFARVAIHGTGRLER
ncbi:hypothetical protein [Deinococcus sp. QL22]|uniref:hypothetical protein n=1 Tax=Deinococcus sp. QL22 TaxID=2939437 RepID=UPI0020177945|nr:hypothetical protein [Deinococcus sp. QL22]UQN10112.1 hypothetical protein M1R55_28390 [Deinococcus sp. QL22]